MIVAILGCGPSGLIARHAAEHAKKKGLVSAVQVYSRKEKSAIYGAQYLHRPVEDIPTVRWENHERIEYRMEGGTPEQYLHKVYGDTWDGTISDDLRDQEHLAWDLRRTYDWLWGMYGPAVVNAVLSGSVFDKQAMYGDLVTSHDLIINTIPRPALCMNKAHRFVSTNIWALGEQDGKEFPITSAANNTVIYNGDPERSWYRLSNMFGYRTVEWPSGTRPPIPGAVLVKKPLRHNCDCMSGLVHLGRMGRWQNGYLAHDVYWDTYEQIELAAANLRDAYGEDS